MSRVDDNAVDPRRILQLRTTEKYLVGAERYGKGHIVQFQRASEFVQISIGQFTLDHTLQISQLHTRDHMSGLRETLANFEIRFAIEIRCLNVADRIRFTKTRSGTISRAAVRGNIVRTPTRARRDRPERILYRPL